MIDRDSGLHAHAGAFARHPGLQPGGVRRRRPTGSSSRLRTIRPRTAASSTTRRTAARPTPTPPAGSRTAPTRFWPPASATCAASPIPARSRPPTTRRHDYISAVRERSRRGARYGCRARTRGLKLGADPLGGAGVAYWGRIAETLRAFALHRARPRRTPPSASCALDWDGKIRMDCSSPYAMAGLIAMKDRSTWPSPAIPITTATESSRVAPGCSIPTTTCRPPSGICSSNRPGWRAAAGGGQDAGFEQHDRPRGRAPGTAAG